MLSASSSLAQWLSYIESQHHQNIDMGLARSRKVFIDLGLDFSKQCVVTVAGTNGKGTTCRFIEQACVAAGVSNAVYASPHIVNFNERIRINGEDASDQDICSAFHAVEQAKGDTTLTYFEYATLAAMYLFHQYNLDVCILEVGLGGRLDATNIVDADIAVITSIGLDHQAYLGNTTELIAAEKAGIIKPHQQVVIGYKPVHDSVIDKIDNEDNIALLAGPDFGHEDINIDGKNYHFSTAKAAIPKQNIMTAIATLSCIAACAELSDKNLANTFMENALCQPFLLAPKHLQALIEKVNMPGRMQILSTQPLLILDVAHNEAAAQLILKQTQEMDYNECHIVIGMLKDKNIEATIDVFAQLEPSLWHCVDLPTQRGEKAARFEQHINTLGQSAVCYASLSAGLKSALDLAKADDLVLVVGSFIVASECMEFIKNS